jgi:hypothetical protein
LLAPEVDSISRQPPAGKFFARAEALAQELAATLDGADGTLILADLAPALGVSLAAQLYARQLARPLLVLPRWPYARAVLPVAELLYALIELAPRRNALQVGHVCVIIDAERERPIPHRSPRDPRADNRYHLLRYDLPNLAALRERGIRRIVKVARA